MKVISGKTKLFKWLLASVLFIGSFQLFSFNNNFTLGLHIDEVRKVDLIRYQLNEYKHPLYMRQTLKPVLNLLKVDLNDSQKIVKTGRDWAAFHGSIAVLFLFLICALYLKHWHSFVMAAIFTITPIVSAHAHYFKEDIFFLAFMLACLYFSLRLLRSNSISDLILTAISSGLMLSTHYKATVFVFIIFVFLKVKGTSWSRLVLMGILALLLFLITNHPLLSEFTQFGKDLVYELEHFREGHAYPISIWQSKGLFHIRNSLFPGLGAPLLFFIIALITVNIRMFQNSELQLVGILLFSYWLLIEISPLKPHPDYSRYAMPLVPLLFILSAASIAQWRWKLKHRYLFLTALALGSVQPALTTRSFVLHLIPDTRDLAFKEWELKRDRCYYELYSLPHKDLTNGPFLCDLNLDSLIRNGYQTAMISQFWYERFISGAKLPGVSEEIRDMGAFYSGALLVAEQRYDTGIPSYAFSNPMLFEVDLIRLNKALSE